MEQNDLVGFQNFLEQEKQLGKRTIAVYIFYYGHFNPLQLSQEYVHDFVVKHKNTPSVRGFVTNYLLFHGITTIKLPEKSKGGNKKKKLIRPVTLDEINRMREFFYKQSFKKGLILDLIYQGALRRFEVATINIGSFRWNDWFADISKFCKLVVLGKGNKERIVLINPETAEAIVNHYMKAKDFSTMIEITSFFESNADVPLIRKSDGELLSERNIYYIIKDGSKKVIGRDVRPHELRHARATELQGRGVSVSDIKNYLGHTRISTTETYLHRTGEESLDKIEETLSQ